MTKKAADVLTILRSNAAKDAAEWSALVEAATELRTCIRISAAHVRAGLLPAGTPELHTILRDLYRALDRFADREYDQCRDCEAAHALAVEYLRAFAGVLPADLIETLHEGFGV